MAGVVGGEHPSGTDQGRRGASGITHGPCSPRGRPDPSLLGPPPTVHDRVPPHATCSHPDSAGGGTPARGMRAVHTSGCPQPCGAEGKPRPDRVVPGQFPRRAPPVHAGSAGTSGGAPLRVPSSPALLHPPHPPHDSRLRPGREDSATGIAASLPAPDHHVFDQERPHQPQAAVTQRPCRGKEFGSISGLGTGRCLRRV
jgi:hypothetical protein